MFRSAASRPINRRALVPLLLATVALIITGPLHGGEPKLSGDHVATDDGDLIIHPIGHATFVMGWKDKTIYVDPVGGATAFADLPRPDLILITDIHADHHNPGTVAAVRTENTAIIAPSAVVKQMPALLAKAATTLANGKTTTAAGIQVEAIPMYNIAEERMRFHKKGRGNGYVLTIGGKRVYISGDTEDIPEMRKLEKIDVAFVCMNLPFTMSVDRAAGAVLEFRPKIVYPYHYRGAGGLSDVRKFQQLVAKDKAIAVRQRDWYPNAQ